MKASDKPFYVYLYLRDKDSEHGPAGSPYYVGKGKDRRAYSPNHNARRPRDWNRIVFVAQNLSEKDAFQLEILLIHLHGRIDVGTGCLRNKTDGGDGPVGALGHWLGKKRGPLTPEWRAAMSRAIKGRKLGPRSPEYRAKLSAARKGRKTGPHTPEWCAAIGAAHRGKEISAEQRAAHSARMRKELPCRGCGIPLSARERNVRCYRCGTTNWKTRKTPKHDVQQVS